MAGLLAYVTEHNLDKLKADAGSEDWNQVNAAFFLKGFVANLFTLDFSELTGTPGRSFAEVYDALAALFAPPSRCYAGAKSTVKVVLASDHDIPGDLFSFQIIRALTPFFHSPALAEKIRFYPGGLARNMAALDSFLNGK